MGKIRFLSLVATAALVLTSCNSEDVIEDVQDNAQSAIRFNVQTKDMRGLEMTMGQLRNSGFGVTAFYTEQKKWEESNIAPNYMYNQAIVNDENKWKYSPLKYWPSRPGDKITFFAYAPYEKEGENKQGIAFSHNTKQGLPSVVLTTKDSPAEMVDFVTAVVVDKTRNADVLKNSIDFSFRHELSRVTFTATNKAQGSFVNIKKASLNFSKMSNVYKSATYTFSSNPAVPGNWNYEEGVKFANFYDLKGILNVKQDVSIGSGKDKYDVDGFLLASGDTKKDLFNGKYLFFIPAEGEKGLNVNSVTVTFDFDIITPDAKLPSGFSATSHVKTLPLNNVQLYQGKAYTVDFEITGPTLDIDANVKTSSM